MSRWVTYYHDHIRNVVCDITVHDTKETALRYFNRNCRNYFEINTDFKAKTLPASYGFPFRKYCGISAVAFKKQFDISIDDALRIITEGEQE